MPCPATYQQEARAIVRTAAPIASAAALTAQPLAACPLRVASALQVGNDCSTFCAASPPSLSLRGGRRPTWQSRSIRLNRGKAIGEIATAFPRLHPKGTSSRFALRAPRPRWGLAMTIRGTVSVLTLPCSARQCSAGPGCPFPCSAPSMPCAASQFLHLLLQKSLSPPSEITQFGPPPSSGGRTSEFVQIREKKEKFYANFC